MKQLLMAVAFLLLPLTACSGGGGSFTPTTSALMPATNATSAMPLSVVAEKQNRGQQEKIYVTNPSDNTVTTYSLDGSLAFLRISDGVFDPISVGVDPSGNIAIANNALDVPQYRASGGAPFNVISGTVAPGLNVTPRALAVNASGTIYVLNTYSDGSANITSYTPAGQQFKPLIPIPSGGEVLTIAGDDNGKIYVSRTSSASITVFDSNGNQLSQFFPPNLALSVAVKSDGRRIYLTSEFPSARINTFDAKGKQMPPTILLKNGLPIAVAVDPNGNIFVRSSTGELTSYSSNGKQISPTIEGLGAISAPAGITVR